MFNSVCYIKGLRSSKVHVYEFFCMNMHIHLGCNVCRVSCDSKEQALTNQYYNVHDDYVCMYVCMYVRMYVCRT